MIENCPRLERVHLAGNTISSDSSFTLNMDMFIVQATKLRDLRYTNYYILKDYLNSHIDVLSFIHNSLQLDLQSANIADASLLLKTLLSCASHLERLVIYFDDFPDIRLSHPFILFVFKSHLLCAYAVR